MLQALVELNVQPGSTVSMGELESFWDSEAPRIGDAHPCLSGLMPWREAERAAKAKSREQATGAEQEHVVRLAHARANVLNTSSCTPASRHTVVAVHVSGCGCSYCDCCGSVTPFRYLC